VKLILTLCGDEQRKAWQPPLAQSAVWLAAADTEPGLRPKQAVEIFCAGCPSTVCESQ
jgi:alkylation response protein AidB-like acyl-CoA dehydrogenase